MTKARQLRLQVDALSRLVRSCRDTERVDVQLLTGDSGWSEEVSVNHGASDSDQQVTLQKELLLAKRSLRELQQMVEDACATALGHACALQ